MQSRTPNCEEQPNQVVHRLWCGNSPVAKSMRAKHGGLKWFLRLRQLNLKGFAAYEYFVARPGVDG